MPSVLLIKMSSLGDVVHALPAVSDAAEHGYTFDWVVEEAFQDIPALHPAVARVLPIAWRRWRGDLKASREEMRAFRSELRAKRYDYVLDSQGLIKSAVVARLARRPLVPRGRRGFSHTVAREPWAAFAYTRGYPVPREQHAIERQRALFAHALDYGASGIPDAGIRARTANNRQVVLLHGTTWASKHYPEPMWLKLAELVQEAGFEAVLTYGNDEEHDRGLDISGKSGATLHPKVSIVELAQVLANAALVIGVDSGLTHLSAALGTPTYGLYGATSGELTGVRGLASGYMQASLPCSPCLDQDCVKYTGDPKLWQGIRVAPACLATVPPEAVWAEASALVRETIEVGP